MVLISSRESDVDHDRGTSFSCPCVLPSCISDLCRRMINVCVEWRQNKTFRSQQRRFDVNCHGRRKGETRVFGASQWLGRLESGQAWTPGQARLVEPGAPFKLLRGPKGSRLPPKCPFKVSTRLSAASRRLAGSRTGPTSTPSLRLARPDRTLLLLVPRQSQFDCLL